VSLSLSLCVPAPGYLRPVRLCPCPCPSVSLFLSLSMSISVLVPIRRCPYPSPCPPLSLYLSLSVCVPLSFPVRLCPSSCPSVSLSLSVCVSVPVRLCPCRCPSVSQSLSVCVPIRLYSCCVLFQRTSLATDNFQCLFYCQKNQRITFEITFVVNGQLSALIAQGRSATDNFQRPFRPIQRTKSPEVTF
jgi:hypothetical protein